MKKFLSTILAVVMVLSSMAMVVSAEDANIPTSNGIWANGVQYSSIDSAAAALSTTGGTIYVYGTVEVDSRQTIAYDDITLEGVANGALVASDNFVNSSETNRKAVLTVTATGTTNIKNIAVDGTNYDDTLADASTFSFKVVRINDGTVDLENVTVEGSKAGLVQVGTSTTDAIVTATNLTATAEVKSINDVKNYADILVVNGSFEMESGDVNGYIATDWDVGEGSIDITADGYFTFGSSVVGVYPYEVCATPGYIAYTYHSNGSLSYSEYSAYASVLAENDDVTKDMMRYVRSHMTDEAVVYSNVRSMVTSLKSNTWINMLYGSKLNTYLGILDGTVE